jgi:hypothetical protein
VQVRAADFDVALQWSFVLDSFVDYYEAALSDIISLGKSKVAIAGELDLKSQTLYVIKDNPYRINHNRLIKLAKMAGWSAPKTLDFEWTWFRARASRGNAELFSAHWDVIGWLSASKQKHAKRKIIDAYVQSIEDKKK